MVTAGMTPRFLYRVNSDRTIDSICCCCYRTVGTAHSKDALHAREAAHECAGCPG